MGKLWKPMVERRWKLMVFQKNMIYMSRFSITKRLLKSNCKILMILLRSDAKVATRKGSNWAQIRSLPRRSLFARFELCTAAMCKESETCQVPKTCTKLPHSHPKRGVLACRISWRSQFCAMY